jgi:hypothetical protein
MNWFDKWLFGDIRIDRSCELSWEYVGIIKALPISVMIAALHKWAGTVATKESYVQNLS